jgi:hypothetical protein
MFHVSIKPLADAAVPLHRPWPKEGSRSSPRSSPPRGIDMNPELAYQQCRTGVRYDYYRRTPVRIPHITLFRLLDGIRTGSIHSPVQPDFRAKTLLFYIGIQGPTVATIETNNST